MGHKLNTVKLDGSMSMSEKACEDYECRSCGKKMISANFVTGICIQVFVTHGTDCGFVKGDGGQRTREVTCGTCRHYVPGSGCVFNGEADARIEAVRTRAQQ